MHNHTNISTHKHTDRSDTKCNWNDSYGNTLSHTHTHTHTCMHTHTNVSTHKHTDTDPIQSVSEMTHNGNDPQHSHPPFETGHGLPVKVCPAIRRELGSQAPQSTSATHHCTAWQLNNNNNNNNNDNNNCTKRRNSRFLQSPHCVANYLQHARLSGQGAIVCASTATHRALNTCKMSCATWYKGIVQLLSLTELKSHLFELYSISWTINRWRRGGNRSTRRKPPMMSFRKCHILNPQNSSPNQDSKLHSSIGGRLGKQMH